MVNKQVVLCGGIIQNRRNAYQPKMNEWKRPPAKGNKSNASTHDDHAGDAKRCLCDNSECRGVQHFVKGDVVGICGNLKKLGDLCTACHTVTHGVIVKTESGTKSDNRDLKIKDTRIDDEMTVQIYRAIAQISRGAYDTDVLKFKDQEFLTHILLGENISKITVRKYHSRLTVILRKDTSTSKPLKKLLAQVVQSIETTYSDILMDDTDSDSESEVVTAVQPPIKRIRMEKNVPVPEKIRAVEDLLDITTENMVVIDEDPEPKLTTLVAPLPSKPDNFYRITYDNNESPFYCLYAVIRSIQHKIATYPRVRDKFQAEPCYVSKTSGVIKRHGRSPFLEEYIPSGRFIHIYIDGILEYIIQRLRELGTDKEFLKRVPQHYKQVSKKSKKIPITEILFPLVKQYTSRKYPDEPRTVTHDNDFSVLSYIYGVNIVLLETMQDGTLFPTTFFLVSKDLVMNDMQDVMNNLETTITLHIPRGEKACMAINPLRVVAL